MKAKRLYKKRRKRVGRGTGSGHGKTSTRGSKGQMSRSGAKHKPGFEGGQMTYIRRIPKRGFTPPFRKYFQIVNLDRLSKVTASEITPDVLLQKGLIRNVEDSLKILGRGEIKRALKIHAHKFSASARDKIEKAGGAALMIGAPQVTEPPVEAKTEKKTTKKKGKTS